MLLCSIGSRGFNLMMNKPDLAGNGINQETQGNPASVGCPDGTEGKTALLDDYPKECPRCQGKLPLTRGVFPLKFCIKSRMLFALGLLILLVDLLIMLPMFIMLLIFGVAVFWFPGLWILKKAFNMRREYRITCRSCGFSFKVKGPPVRKAGGVWEKNHE
jgi:hypothetical protein